MKIKFSANCLGFSVGGNGNYFEIEIEENELTRIMTEEEKENYIETVISDYITERMEFGYEIK